MDDNSHHKNGICILKIIYTVLMLGPLHVLLDILDQLTLLWLLHEATSLSILT